MLTIKKSCSKPSSFNVNVRKTSQFKFDTFFIYYGFHKISITSIILIQNNYLVIIDLTCA